MPDAPEFKELVLLGGGHSHVEVLRRFGMARPANTGITVICRDVDTPYSGMLPGHIAGHYGFDEIHIDLRPLCRFAGARLFVDEAVGLDLAQRLVICRDRPPVRYDVLSIDTGSTPSFDGVPGAAEAVVPVKPISQFLRRWQALCARLLATTDPVRIGVVGAGSGGVELLLAIQHRLRALLSAAGQSPARLEFHLFGADAEPMPTHNRHVRDAFRRVLTQRGVHLHLPFRADRFEPGRLWQGAECHALDEILWVTQAAAPDWPRAAGLAVDDAGFIAIDDGLRSLSHRQVFASGDVATMVNHRRPKAGVYAVRQGPPLARNLERALMGLAPLPFRPQRHALALISTGDRTAIASRGALYARGAWLWRIKDRIDRRFMERYADLPAMTPNAEPMPDAMRCGGCGAKIGADALSAALAGLQPVQRPDVLVGLADRADAAVVAVPPGKVMVHSVDHFRAFVDDPFVFGRIAANHALGDLYAMNAAPQSALAIATLPFGPPRWTAETLRAMLDGAVVALAECGASLVGGHSGEGAELALGFAVNGLADRDRLARRSGMVPGQRLILTKPLGTGTLLAADMRGAAKGRWIQAALASMQVSSRDAARILFAHGATACTDVTGFGLIGHLVGLLDASKVGAALDIAAVPVLDGALETARAGLLSTLHDQNARFASHIRDGDSSDPRWPLLFDPQTAGGLLAAVPAEAAAQCLEDLRAIYPLAAIVGTVAVRDGAARVRMATPGRNE